MVIFLIMTVAAIKSQADNATSSTTIMNANPDMIGPFFQASLANGVAPYYTDGAPSLPFIPSTGSINTSTANGLKTIYVVGTITDINGIYPWSGSSLAVTHSQLFGSSSSTSGGDLTSLAISFFRSGLGGGSGVSNCDSGAETDKNSCYFALISSDNSGECTFTVTSVTTVDFFCPFHIASFVDATDVNGSYASNNWVTSVKITDDAGGSKTKTASTEISSVLSLEIPATINYGALYLGQITTNETNTTTTFVQTGNDAADVNVSYATSTMACTNLGSINSGNQRWSITDVSFDYASALTSAVARAPIEVALRTSDTTANTKPLYWNITIPSSGVSGTCTGTNIISAVSAQE